MAHHAVMGVTFVNKIHPHIGKKALWSNYTSWFLTKYVFQAWKYVEKMLRYPKRELQACYC